MEDEMRTDTEESTDSEELAVIFGVDRTNLETTYNEHVDYPGRTVSSTKRMNGRETLTHIGHFLPQ